MTEEIRAQVRAELDRLGMSQSALGSKIGKTRIYVNKMLTGAAASAVPESWQATLDVLGLELYVRPKSGAPAPAPAPATVKTSKAPKIRK